VKSEPLSICLFLSDIFYYDDRILTNMNEVNIKSPTRR